ncbi:hypothetical protein J3R30DRAFT_679003 [Lentinula aciculospora]|uniref:Uncharacterized protein n=1 Tax=Lentinula aciculospora TaxID=153920 RepID=A0A9W9A4T6_9AGAR|nr:hypothetical protein J3R30DRAFT_679003 [Lentinula aciculospora]
MASPLPTWEHYSGSTNGSDGEGEGEGDERREGRKDGKNSVQSSNPPIEHTKLRVPIPLQTPETRTILKFKKRGSELDSDQTEQQYHEEKKTKKPRLEGFNGDGVSVAASASIAALASKPKTPFNPATTHPQSKFKSAFRNQARKTTGIVPYRQRREREREQEQLSASAGAGKGVAVDSARGGPESGSVTKRVKRSREEGRKGRSQSPSPHGRSKSIPIPSPLVPPPSLPLLSHGSTKANAISIDSNSNPSSDSDLESFALAGKLNGPGPAPVSRLSGVARAHRGSRTRQQVSGVAQLTRDSRLISDLPLSGQDTINSKDSDAEDEDSRMIIDSPVFSTGTINEGVQSPAFLKLNSKPKSTLKPRLPQIAIRTKPKPKPASTSNKPSSTTPATPAGAAAVVIPEPTIISSDSEPGKSRLLEDEGEEMIHGPPLTPLLHSHSPQNANPKLQIQGVKPQPRLKPNEKAKPKDRGEPEDDKKWLQSLTEAFDISGQANFPIPTSGKGKRKGDDKGKGKERKGRNTDRGIGALSDSFTPLPGSKAYLHALTQSQNARQPKLNPLTQRPPVQNSQTQTAQRVPPTRPTHRLSLAQTNPLVQKGFFLNDDPSERPSSPSFPSSFSLSPSSSVPPPSSLPERAHNQNPKIPSFSSSPSSPSSSSSSSSSSEIQSTPVLPSQQRAERKRKEKEKTLELLNILGRQNQSQIPGGSQNLNLSQTQIQQETQDDPTLFPPLDYVDCDRLYDEQPPPLPLRQKQSPLPPPPLIQFRTPLKTITQLWTNPELLSGRRLVRFIVSREERVSGRSGNEHNNGVHDRDRARGGDKDPSPVVVVVVKWELIYQFYNEKKGRVDYDGFDAEHEHDENGVDEAKRDVDQKEDNDEKKKVYRLLYYLHQHFYYLYHDPYLQLHQNNH